MKLSNEFWSMDASENLKCIRFSPRKEPGLWLPRPLTFAYGERGELRFVRGDGVVLSRFYIGPWGFTWEPLDGIYVRFGDHLSVTFRAS